MTTNETKYIAALQRRATTLEARIGDHPNADYLRDAQRETKALRWAIGIVERLLLGLGERNDLTHLATLYTAEFTLDTGELLRLSHFISWCEKQRGETR